MLDSYAQNWVMSSEIICNEAIKRWLTVEIIDKQKNFYSLSDRNKKVYFKANDCGIDSSIWIKIADDKELSYIVAMENEIKIPKTQYLDRSSLQNLEKASIEIPYPLITKPANWAHGDWVAIWISKYDELLPALEFSFHNPKTERVIIQEQIQGDDFRVIVVWGKFIAAAKRNPPHIIWNWKNTIHELIEIQNNSNFSDNPYSSKGSIKIDSELHNTLKEQGYDMNSILEYDTWIFVRKNANLSTWWTAIDVTDKVHPDVIAEAIQYADILWLWLAGVDIVTNDITKPLEDTNGAIIEINNTPGLRMHHFPSEWTPRNVAWALLDYIFI